MSATQYKINFELLCKRLELGNLIKKPLSVSGGLLHKMFKIETVKGLYALKALNPEIMKRPTALKNIKQSEQIASIAAQHINAHPALKINSTFIQEIDGQYYFVYNWIEGRSLKSNEIENTHCAQIGSMLADLHVTDFSELDVALNAEHDAKKSDWNFYLKEGKENKLMWGEKLEEMIENLYKWDKAASEANTLLMSELIISHRDLDSKNVMWDSTGPIVIDWESAGAINPIHDLIETAIYWSESNGEIDKGRFMTLINAYKEKRAFNCGNWRTVLEMGFSAKLGWLEYNLKRSLLIECSDQQEQKMGIQQVTSTLNDLNQYANNNPRLEEWLNNEVI